MITKVGKGSRVRGLVEYLFGPGRQEEHTNQRIVAAWDETWAGAKQPSPVQRAQLTAEFNSGLMLLPEGAEAGRYVYHLSISNHARDRKLSDAEWRMVAERAADRLGFDASGSRAQARWFAVHHGEAGGGRDHIHFVGSLVREDGSRVRLGRDFALLRELAKELRSELGLGVRTNEVGAGTRGLSRAELERSQRAGEPPSRFGLRRCVRAAATAARSEAEFVSLVADQGVLIRPRWAKGGREKVEGYSVALRTAERERLDAGAGSSGSVAAHGRRLADGRTAGVKAHRRGTRELADGVLWIGGRLLDHDLSITALRATWGVGGDTAESVAAWRAHDPWAQRRAAGAEPEAAVGMAYRSLGTLAGMLERTERLGPRELSAIARDFSGVAAAFAVRSRGQRYEGEAAAMAAAMARAAGFERTGRVRGSRAHDAFSDAARILLRATRSGNGAAAILEQCVRLARAIERANEATERVVLAQRAAEASALGMRAIELAAAPTPQQDAPTPQQEWEPGGRPGARPLARGRAHRIGPLGRDSDKGMGR